MASLLEGSAFITGAASGIGQQAAFAFAKYGIDKLALADISLGGLEKTAATLREQWPHVEVLTLNMDVTNTEEVKGGIAEVVAKFGRLDIAVNNAGIAGQNGQLHALDDSHWQKVLDINLNGVYRCQKEELGIMVNQDSEISAQGEDEALLSTCPQSVMGMTKADANSYAGSGIRINAICPGYIETPMVASETKKPTDPDHPLNGYVTHTPMRRLGMPEEIADSIVYLASPLSSYVNGAGLVVDGGFSTS